MTEQFNPYAPPRSVIEEQPLHSDNVAWRSGKVLILRRDGALPHRCIKCNLPARQPIKTFKLYWHHPAWYLLVLLNIIFYAIVAMVVRKRVEIQIGLCQHHFRRYRLGRWIGWGGSLGMLTIAMIGAANNATGILVLGCLGVLVSLIFGIVLSRVAHPTRIDSEYIRIKGSGREFLSTLPEFPLA
ncbi:MAG: hypothetical protein JWM03_1440 [Rhodocyclales bacterium]|nr:hypothetical protein [Rhodocyclales bacterium]